MLLVSTSMKTIFITIILSITAVISNAQNGNHSDKTVPTKIVVYNSDYSLAITLQYVLTQQDIQIIHKAELKGEKDSVFFNAKLDQLIISKQLSQINIDSLKERYDNPCVQDGLQITVVIYSGKRSKMVHISNYYQPDIDNIIKLINSVVPPEYPIWYDKEKLVQRMEDCKY